jgi:Protein of unknown function (DUF3618)
MSIEGKVVDTAPGPPDDPQGLQQEIERTREHLGQTVEALVAKVDVKARAQDEAGRLIGRLKAKAVQARQQAAARAADARRQAADKTAGPRQKATVQGRHVRHQVADKTAAPLQQAASLGGSVAEQVKPQAAAVAAGISKVKPQAAAVAAGISKVTPELVKQAAGNAAATARQRRTPLLAAIGAVGAGLVGWLLFQRWRRRG